MARRKKTNPAQRVSASTGLSVATPTRVFISYRRTDTDVTAAHLHHSLGLQLGSDKVFRDADTIQPGQDFEKVIEEALRSTSVCIVLIGPSWLDAKNSEGERRLDTPKDYVRTEIESALRAGVEIIPILIDGATMPSRKDLPKSIAELSVRNAFPLPWSPAIARLATRINQIERQREAREAAERAERERLDLTEGEAVFPGSWRSQSAIVSFNVVVRAMEMSLARQGQKVWLSAADLARSYKTSTKRSLDTGFFAPEILHIIDFVGVKAKKSNSRYVARSYPLSGFAEVPAQLALGRPILVGVQVQDSWFKSPIMKTGIVDFQAGNTFLGTVLGAILGWDPAKQVVKLLSPWSTWGNRGTGILTKKAADEYLQSKEMHSIEAVLMPPSPFAGQSKNA
jgi:hypothetical protein